MILDEYAHIIQSLVEEVCNLQMFANASSLF